jgi:hypothetical protein
MMKKKILVVPGVAAILLVIVFLTSCSGGGGGATFSPTWIVPAVSGSLVTVPMSMINTKNDLHFKIDTAQGPIGFVAYSLNGTTQVRAKICVPCQGQSFTLQGDKLVCNTCGTVFSAVTGKGLSGVPACQSYAKAAVPFTTSGDNIVMKTADLQNAYDKTVNRLP